MAYEKKSFNEVLKERELREKAERAMKTEEDYIALDDSQRVKVLSPGRLVFKRFIRNRLAIVGSCILIFMFLFSFCGPLVYPYGQTERFYKYENQIGDYAGAQIRTEFTNYEYGENDVEDSVARRVNSAIMQIASSEDDFTVINVDSGNYLVKAAEDENIYQVLNCTQEEIASFAESVAIGNFNRLGGTVAYNAGIEDKGADFYNAALAALDERTYAFEFDGLNYEIRNYNKVGGDIFEVSSKTLTYTGEAMPKAFETAIFDAVSEGLAAVSYDGDFYLISGENGVYNISRSEPADVIMVSTTYVFNTYDADAVLSDEFKAEALMAVAEGGEFECDGVTYKAEMTELNPEIVAQDGTPVAQLSYFVVRGADGKDTFDIAFKDAVEEAVLDMESKGAKTTTFTYDLLQKISDVDEEGNETVIIEKDENGNDLYKPTEITVTKQVNDYVLTCPILRHLFDINNMPSAQHLFGTDSDGYDVLARMMYGGRISLIVGFIVVILETILGTLLGGIAGYFGGWVDNLIMRLVDIFYCIPSMPILIIMGAYMDALKMNPYERLAWMMAILGILGWASVARLVRGQILSLREQEFMVAAEATGVRVRKRIFRHLVPNVMPQLIVTATAGLGGVIIEESTLSFLGLGVKHPLATWGTMINSITQRNEDMIKYTYIWIPVGLLICLTVIAFNFVGDGLRDAFDPKMKK